MHIEADSRLGDSRYGPAWANPKNERPILNVNGIRVLERYQGKHPQS